jgi:hypothetical protein
MDPIICPVCDDEVIDPVEWPITYGEAHPELVCRGCRDAFLLGNNPVNIIDDEPTIQDDGF